MNILGALLRVYCGGDKTSCEVPPDFVDPPSAGRVFSPDFLEGEWDLCILSPEGFKNMQEIVAYMKVGRSSQQCSGVVTTQRLLVHLSGGRWA